MLYNEKIKTNIENEKKLVEENWNFDVRITAPEYTKYYQFMRTSSFKNHNYYKKKEIAKTYVRAIVFCFVQLFVILSCLGSMLI